jgi:dTDP-4-amino-4,6-dideoxygalactose transaminase
MIPFNIPCFTGEEMRFMQQALEKRQIAGNGYFTQLCQSTFKEKFNFQNTLLTPSGTAALEMAAMLCDFQPGQEVILPTFTHVSTANAFIRAGAKLRFADSLLQHPNMDPDAVTPLIGPNTKAIVVVHYAGMACNMNEFRKIAQRHQLLLIEDAAHALGALYDNTWLGLIGDFAAFSFHETKNITCGQGGLLVVNRTAKMEDALQIWHHGTDRIRYESGKTSYYTWTRPGGAFLMADLNAAFLYPQLRNIHEINARRMQRWVQYYTMLLPLEKNGLFQLPMIPSEAQHNAHIFYLITADAAIRNNILIYLQQRGVQAVFHYIPLHTSPYATDTINTPCLPNAERIGANIIRLPLYDSISALTVEKICDLIKDWIIDKTTIAVQRL